MRMRGYNLIAVYNRIGDQVLMCRRSKPPYQGLLNFVGGKIEPEEDGLTAAYRELWEETGIGTDMIRLRHVMDLTYYTEEQYMEVYTGKLQTEAILREEKNKLLWIDRKEDFFNMTVFAGQGNLGHILEIIDESENRSAQ